MKITVEGLLGSDSAGEKKEKARLNAVHIIISKGTKALSVTAT